MRATYEQIEARLARDKRSAEKLAAIAAGDCMEALIGKVFPRWINQGNRSCLIYAVSGARYAYEYEMPSGGSMVRIGNTSTGKERTVSLLERPLWARMGRGAV